MTDLEINIALAKAMGWVETTDSWLSDSSSGAFINANGYIWCLPNSEYPHQQKPFDYRDPVIFVAICKRWSLGCSFYNGCNIVRQAVMSKFFKDDSIEKAAALCVIDAVKRGIK